MPLSTAAPESLAQPHGTGGDTPSVRSTLRPELGRALERPKDFGPGFPGKSKSDPGRQRCCHLYSGEKTMRSFSTNARTATGRDLFKDKPKKIKETPKQAGPEIQIGEHGRYQIKSGRLSGEYVARAFPKQPTNTRGLIAETRGATEEAAIAALHEVIDARDSRRAEERRIASETGSAVPTTAEFVEAIGQVALSRPQAAMLTALAIAEDDGLPEMRIAYAAGYKSQASANRALAAAGLLLANYLSVELATTAETSAHEGIALLGFRGAPPKDDVPGNWILHPELREAVRAVL